MDDVEKVKQKIDIVDLLSEYITLKKAGRNFKANCPFHNEKTPSFVISPERQIWHCFGCGKGGDVFSFLIEYERIEFPEALKYLAEKAGIKLSETSLPKSETTSKKELIYTINHLACAFYNFLLLEHPVGQKALSYLTEKRKLPKEIIKTFNLGYAPAYGSPLCKYLIQKKNYKANDLVEAGIAFYRYGRTEDFFRNRIIFPIADTRGNTAAFAGRILDDNAAFDGPKYINTRETLVYRKGETFFGLNLAREEIKKENRVIIVEGEFDVISAFKEGVKNVVAVKGTALTDSQIKTLKRYAEKLSFCFDTDKAGIDAQKRSIMLIEKANISASVIILPEGKDPDELVKENSTLFKKAVKKDVNIFDFIIDSALKEYDPGTAEGKKNILKQTLDYLTLIENEVLKEHYMKKLALSIDTSLESVLRQADKIKNQQMEKENILVRKQLSREELIESYLLSLILQGKNPKELFMLSKEIIAGNEFSTLLYKRLYNHLEKLFIKEEFSQTNALAKAIPAEFSEAFNKCCLMPLSEMEKEKYDLEVKTISEEVKNLSLKNQLKKIGDRIREKEKKGEEIENLKEEFNKLTDLLSRPM